MDIIFPRYASSVPLQFERVIKALLGGDQFDDWLPDPVYYADRINDGARTRKRAETIWQADSPAKFEVEALSLPRAGGTQLRALALPLEIRICAHALITVMAGRISKSLRRDKVYGFRFLRAGSRVFDPPGVELGDVFDLVATAARSTKQGTFEILDMVSFNSSARPDRLVEVLQRCGARSDECNVLGAFAHLGGEGLPSVDDAFAFVYNFYLQPVDEELIRQRHNFFRYRDEYFVFAESTKKVVSSGAAKLGLDVRVKGRSKHLDDVKDDLKGEITRKNPSASVEILNLPGGSIRAVVECDSFNDEQCTDYSELKFEQDDRPIESLFKEPANSLVDAVSVLPVLRSIHMARRTGVLLAPPFTGETPEFARYRTAMRGGRSWLNGALATAIKAGSPWQAGWSATLLSDIGALSDAETQMMLRLLKTPSMTEPARMQVRIALARSSTLKDNQFWTQAAGTTEYRKRSALVASRHLARRSEGAWKAMQASVGTEEPELVRHLMTNIRGIS